jgi:hypothetical protein
MASSDTVAALIGAAIGASGAVAAQIVSSWFTARREAWRLQWEREQQVRRDPARVFDQRRDDERRTSERFLDIKRELYSRFLTLCSSITREFDTYAWGETKSFREDLRPVDGTRD